MTTLRKAAGARDYVFYFVPDPGPRQIHAEVLPEVLSHHVGHEVASLKELIATRRADVAQHGVQQIRELVIASHGTSLRLVVPLLASTIDQNLQVLPPTPGRSCTSST